MGINDRKLSAEDLQNGVNKIKKYAKYAVSGILALTVFFGSFSTVGPGQRGVMVTLGKTGSTVLGEGPHVKLPFISEIRTMSVRLQKSQDKSEAATKDLQRVTATVALNWTINPESVGKMLREVGDESSIETNIIAPAVSEVLKASTAKMTAEEVLTRRMELKLTIDDMLIKRLTSYGLIIKDISLVDLDFTREFNHAVEAKQIAEQEAKQAEYNAQRATQDAKAALEKAKGEAASNLAVATAQAQAQDLLRKSITKDVLQLEYLKKWDGRLPTVMSGNASGLILNLPTTNTKPSKNEEQE